MALVGNKWTLTQLTSLMETFMQDPTNARWSDANIAWAIREAMRAAPPRWWEERIDDSQTYSESAFRYSLPPACQSVEEVYFAALDEDKPRKFVEPTSWHIEEGELVFSERYDKYDGQTLYIYYIVYPDNLLTCTNTDGVVDSHDLHALTSAGATFISSGVRIGDAVELAQGTFYVKSVDSETQLTLHKNMTAGTGLTYHVARYTDMPVAYVENYAASCLYELAGRNRPGVEVEEVYKQSAYYRQVAEQELVKQRKSRRSIRRY